MINLSIHRSNLPNGILFPQIHRRQGFSRSVYNLNSKMKQVL